MAHKTRRNSESMTVAGKKMEGFFSSSPMVTQQAVVGFCEGVFCVWGRETRSYRFLRRGHLSTNFQRTKQRRISTTRNAVAAVCCCVLPPSCLTVNFCYVDPSSSLDAPLLDP